MRERGRLEDERVSERERESGRERTKECCARSREFESRTDGINCTLFSSLRGENSRERSWTPASLASHGRHEEISITPGSSICKEGRSLPLAPPPFLPHCAFHQTNRPSHFCSGPHRPPILPSSSLPRPLRLLWNNGRIICSGAVPPGLKGSSEFGEQPLAFRYHPHPLTSRFRLLSQLFHPLSSMFTRWCSLSQMLPFVLSGCARMERRCWPQSYTSRSDIVRSTFSKKGLIYTYGNLAV